jgi:hypothetical protein
MAARYEVLKDYLNLDQSEPLPASVGDIAMAPYWALAVYRYRQAVTYSRTKMQSITATPDDAVRIAGNGPLIITSDCLSLTVESNKASFQGSLSAELIQGEVNYLSEILPGDWVGAWICTNEEDVRNVILNLNSGQPANAFTAGFKFLGRVTSLRKELRVDANGIKSSMYNLQAASFKELDAGIFFDPYLLESQSGIAEYLDKLGIPIASLVVNSQGGIDVNKMLPLLFDILIGTGIPNSVSHAGRGGNQGGLGPGGTPKFSAPPPQVVEGLNTAEGTAPYSYLIPMEVGSIVGKFSSSKGTGIISAADLNNTIIGLQQYRSGSNNGAQPVSGAPQLMFIPDGITNAGSRYYTPYPMMGVFLPSMPDFADKSVWTILNQFLNPVTNEMFATLRVDPDGNVVPTVIARQLPFSTELLPTYFVDNPDLSIGLTRFLEVPRWNLDPLLVIGASIGRSDALRFNFVHFYGQSEAQHIVNYMSQQLVLNPPYRDDNDAKRNGLRSLMGTVASDPKDTQNGSARKWMALQADFHMNGHLALTGTITSFGIQAPIAIGDNCEWDGVVYHIESVSHSASILGGVRSFHTTLQLSHGLRAAESDDQTLTQNQEDIWAGLLQGDNTDLDPGISYDAQNPNPGPAGLRAYSALGISDQSKQGLGP